MKKRNKLKVNCSLCGDELERDIVRPKYVCYNCKRQKQAVYGLKNYHRKKNETTKVAQ